MDFTGQDFLNFPDMDFTSPPLLDFDAIFNDVDGSYSFTEEELQNFGSLPDVFTRPEPPALPMSANQLSSLPDLHQVHATTSTFQCIPTLCPPTDYIMQDEHQYLSQINDTAPPAHVFETPIVCNWPNCKSGLVFPREEDLQDHQTKVHVTAVIEKGPGPCTWPDCTSKAMFKKRPLLVEHVYNVHVDPLYCTEERCHYKRPFGKQCDLDRHKKSQHSHVKPFECLDSRCFAREKSFSRKDKFKLHLREFHGENFCQLPHCRRGPGHGFSSELKLKNHSAREHGYFECHIGSCARTGFSRFSFLWSNVFAIITSHLKGNHGLSHEAAWKLEFNFRGSAYVITENMISDGTAWHDCEECAQKLKETESLYHDTQPLKGSPGYTETL